ncbi:MAG: TolC family protein [Kiritimatiellae bacterium]|nr:TolC family protein [Kiritimatiellia bacterium]
MCADSDPIQPTRPRKEFRLSFFRAISAAALVAGLNGCQSARLDDWTVASRPVPERERAIRPEADPDDQGPMELADVVAYALSTHPDITALRAAVHRASGDAAETLTPRPPEIRLGYGLQDEDSSGWARRSETGTRRRSGTSTSASRETGSETSSSERWEFGWPTETSSSLREFSQNAQSTQTSAQQSQYRTSAYSSDVGSQDEDNFRVGLRYYPPNPWIRSAEGEASRARIGMAHAELAAEEHALACDIVEAAVQVAYGERLLRTQELFVARCRAMSDEIREAMNSGFLPRSDYLDARLRLAAAEADHARSTSRLAAWRQKFRACSGVDPARVALDPVTAGAFCLPPGDPDQLADYARRVAAHRPDVLAAYWNWMRHSGEWRRARSAAFPWFSYLEVSYTRWDATDRRTRTVEESGSETRTAQQNSTGSSARTETEDRTSSDFTTEHSSSSQTSIESGTRWERDYETSRGWAQEYSRGEADGDEWWFGLAVEIPIFEWISDTRQERRLARIESMRGYDFGRRRAEREILMAGEALRTSLADLEKSRNSLRSDQQEIEDLAREFEDLGLEGKLEALRIRERGVDMDLLRLNRELDFALDELQFCRASGLTPGQPGSPVPESIPAKESPAPAQKPPAPAE